MFYFVWKLIEYAVLKNYYENDIFKLQFYQKSFLMKLMLLQKKISNSTKCNKFAEFMYCTQAFSFVKYLHACKCILYVPTPLNLTTHMRCAAGSTIES